jgi:tetratricopeptide (TPR) repeat protein
MVHHHGSTSNITPASEEHDHLHASSKQAQHGLGRAEMLQEHVLSRASNNYHSGHFERAAEDFSAALVASGHDDGGNKKENGSANANDSPNANDGGGNGNVTNTTACTSSTGTNMFGGSLSGSLMTLSLSSMALKADESLCTFRSALESASSNANADSDSTSDCKSDGKKSCVELLKGARRDNEIYLLELQGVIQSLCMDMDTNHMDAYADVHHNTRNRTCTPRTEGKSDSNSSTPTVSIDQQKLQLSMAVLMATVTRSWLYLHTSTSAVHPFQHELSATNILKRGIALACCPFVSQNPATFSPTWNEAMSILQNALSNAMKMSTLYRTEAERLQNALRVFRNAARVVGLRGHHVGSSSSSQDANGGFRIVMDSCTGMKNTTYGSISRSAEHNHSGQDPANPAGGGLKIDHVRQTSNKRGRATEVEVSATNGQAKKSKVAIRGGGALVVLSQSKHKNEDRSKLALQEHLVKALYHHRNADVHNSNSATERRERDKCMQRALEIEKNGIAQKLNVFFQAIDLLQSSRVVQQSKHIGNGHANLAKRTARTFTKEMIQYLTALSSASATSASLLGCIHAKSKYYGKALECFERALTKQQQTPSGMNSHEGRRHVISNVAQCFGMLQDPETLLELLLHWISLYKDGDDDNDGRCLEAIAENVTVHPLCLGLNEDSESFGHGRSGMRTKMSVLHRLYHAATLVKDWDTCHSALSELKEISNDSLIPIAEAFVELETGNCSKSYKLMIRHKAVEPMQQEWEGDSFTSLAFLMYEADALVAQALMQDGDSDDGNVDADSRVAKANISEAHRIWNKIKSNASSLGRDTDAIEGCFWNNYGMTLIMNGRPTEAMSCFLKAMKAFESRDELHSSETAMSSSPYTLAMFNLSLTLWRQGSKLKACKFYLQQRSITPIKTHLSWIP